MKKLFQILLLFLPFWVQAQAPVNDLCQNAEDLPLTSNFNPIITVQGNCFGASPTLDIPLSDSVCGTWKANRRDVWYKFKATSSRGRFWFKGELSGFRYQLFSGSCNGMRQIYCAAYNIQACCVDSGNYSSFFRDSTYYIRVYNFESMSQVNLNFKIGLRFFSSGIIKSKITGGVWEQGTTWEGNQVPSENDSIQITEGSNVSVLYSPAVIKAKWLKVGSGDTLKKAIFNLGPGASLGVAQGLILTKGDSIVCRNPNGSLSTTGASISSSGNMRLDGGINIRNFGLSFGGNTPITVAGIGSIVQKTYGAGFGSSNTAGVDMHFGGTIEFVLGLGLGNIHFLKPMVYNLRPPSFNSFSLANNVLKFRGTYSGLFSYKIPNDFLAIKGKISFDYKPTNDLHLPENDTITRPGKEFINAQFMRRIVLNRSSINNVFYLDSTISLEYFNTFRSPIRMRNPQDTLFAHTFWMANEDTARGYMDQGNICLWNDPAFGIIPPFSTNSAETIKVSRGGKCRNVSIFGQWWAVPDQKICVEVVPSPPSGILPASLTNFAGHSVLQLKAARPIPVGTLKIEMQYWKSDNILANKKEIFIIQGLSPNGPWKVVSKDSNSVFDARITYPLDFSNGYFFAFATSSQIKEMTALEVLPPPQYYQTGCGNMPNLRLGVRIQNKAVLNADNFLVGYQMQGEVAQNQFVSYGANNALKPLKTDTVWFEGVSGLSLPTSELRTIKAWVKMIGDTVVKNDTIVYKLDLRPYPFPYSMNFDTVKRISRISNVGNLPFRWYDTLQYDNFIKKAVNGFPLYQHYFQVDFADQPTVANNHALWLTQGQQPGAKITTHRIGPIQKPALIELKHKIAYRGEDTLYRSDMKIGDTLFVEGSEDCGQNWVKIFIIHRNNRILSANKQWLRDSLTFSNGSFVSIRFRYVYINPLFVDGPADVQIDSLRLYPGVITTANQTTISSMEEVRLYPNPSNGKMQLDLPASWAFGEKLLQIINMKGQLVFQSSFSETEKEIHLPEKSEGIYYLLLQAGKKLHTQKLVLRR